LFGPEQLDDNFRFPAGEFVYRITVSGEVDETNVLSMKSVFDRRSTHRP
jgi:hypothetical protein